MDGCPIDLRDKSTGDPASGWLRASGGQENGLAKETAPGCSECGCFLVVMNPADQIDLRDKPTKAPASEWLGTRELGETGLNERRAREWLADGFELSRQSA